jgi:hypothetical protein
LRAAAAGRWTGYPDHKQLLHYNASFGADGSYRPSGSTNWWANAFYGFGYSDSSRILLEQGVSLPVVKTRSLAAELGLSKRVGTQTSVRIDGRFYHTDFESQGLMNGTSVRGTSGLEHHLDDRSTAAIEYALEYVSNQADKPYLTHFGSLQWTRVLSVRSALLLEGGGSYTPDAARAGLQRKGSFFGGASFTRQVKRSSLTLFVRREVTPAFGIGVSRLELRAGLAAIIPMGRVWSLRMVAFHVQPEARLSVDRVYGSSDDAFAGLDHRLGRHLEVSGEARYRRRGATSAIPMIEEFRAGLFLTLLTPSGRAIGLGPGLSRAAP